MSVGCDEGTFRFPEKCDEVTLSPCIFCDAVTKICANREKMQGLCSSHDVYKPFSFWSVYFHNTKVLHPFFCVTTYCKDSLTSTLIFVLSSTSRTTILMIELLSLLPFCYQSLPVIVGIIH